MGVHGRRVGERDTSGPAVRRRRVLLVLLTLGLLPLGYVLFAWLTFPSDHTPEGAYLRVVIAVNKGDPARFFAYTETAAQHASYTIRDYRKRSSERVAATFPEPDRSRWLAQYRPYADCSDGADVFALYARQRGWLTRLRRDLSGISRVEVRGDRATVVTAHGTRYPFRRRDNGIWGMTQFTPVLAQEAERAARDAALIEQAASDYQRARGAELSPAAPRPSH